jgi:RNA polymerase sigma-70 factor (ECF subfamily)
VWKNRHKLNSLDNFPSWLYTITRNRSITALQKVAREQQKHEEFISWMPDHDIDNARKVDDQHLRQLLEIALSRLTNQQRRVFELSRLQGLSRTEIAREMDLAPATVSVHLTIALRFVRAFLTSRMEYSILIVAMANAFRH